MNKSEQQDILRKLYKGVHTLVMREQNRDTKVLLIGMLAGFREVNDLFCVHAWEKGSPIETEIAMLKDAAGVQEPTH